LLAAPTPNNHSRSSVRDTLYLQLRDPATDGLLSYAVTGTQPGLGVIAERAPLERILGQAAGRRIVLLVPGGDVRLVSVKVPARQPQKVLQAAPYQLEDQLAEDVETLHFAIGARLNDGSHPVAVVARSRMEQWMAPFRARGLRPDAVIPETLCLPAPEPGTWTALAEASQITVRTGTYAGFTCPLEDLDGFLQLADPAGQTTLRLFVTRDTEHDFTRIGRPLELLAGHASALEVLVRHWRPEDSINLMQGPYSQQEDWQRLVQPWRVAGAFAALWIILAVTHEAVTSWRLGAEIRAQQAENAQRFQQIFPGQTPTADLARQLAALRLQMQGDGSRAPLFPLLDVLAASMSATSGLTLRSLQYREGALYLNLTGNDLQSYENLRNWFATRRDARIDPQSVSAGGEGVQIRLKLELA
jgi:general secretion pathway protein L